MHISFGIKKNLSNKNIKFQFFDLFTNNKDHALDVYGPTKNDKLISVENCQFEGLEEYKKLKSRADIEIISESEDKFAFVQGTEGKWGKVFDAERAKYIVKVVYKEIVRNGECKIESANGVEGMGATALIESGGRVPEKNKRRHPSESTAKGPRRGQQPNGKVKIHS